MADQMRFYNKEVADLLHLKSSRNLLQEEALLLLQYCCELVLEIDKSDVPEDEMIIESETFGRAYYFTKHGCQVRNVRGFSIDRDRENMLISTTLPENCAQRNFRKSVKEA